MKALLIGLLCLGASVSAQCGEETKAAAGKSVTVYYFHNTWRCLGCNTVESVAKAAVLGGKGENTKEKTEIEVKAPHPERVKDGSLAFTPVNVDKEPGKALFEKLGNHLKMPVIVVREGGRVASITALDKAWAFFDDNQGYVDYVQRALKAAISTKAKSKAEQSR